MKIQEIVLKEIYLGEENQDVDKLSESTGLTKTQIHNALKHLVRRRLIYKVKKSLGAKRNIPPENKIYVKINDNVINRIRKIIGEENGNY